MTIKSQAGRESDCSNFPGLGPLREAVRWRRVGKAVGIVGGKMCGRPQRGASLADRGGQARGQRSPRVPQVRRLMDTSGVPRRCPFI